MSIKVLHLRAGSFLGGPERQLMYHALRSGDDVEIRVASFTEGGEIPEFINVMTENGVKTDCLTVKSSYDFSSIKQLRNYLTDNKIDVLCTHEYRSHLIGWLARRNSKTIWIAFSRGWTWENLKIRLFHFIDKIILRLAHRIVAVSFAQKELLKKYMISDKKISVIHNAIDPARFNDINAINLKEKFNLPNDSLVYVTVGRFSGEKGQIIMVKAAIEAIKRNDKIAVVMYGDGPDFDECKKLISESSMQHKIICPGFEKNAMGAMKGADYLVNPSLSEGLPNVVLEAMAVNLPVIATSVGGVPEIITDNISGILVKPNNIKDLTEKMLYCASNSDHAKSLSEEAFKQIKRIFSFDAQNRKLSELYHELFEIYIK